MEILERMPWLAKDAVFQRLASIAEVAALSKEDREKYDESLRKYRDTISVMEGQYQEGWEKGLAEGEAKGLAEGEAKGEHKRAINSARQMKADGMSMKLIMKYTGLTADVIENL